MKNKLIILLYSVFSIQLTIVLVKYVGATRLNYGLADCLWTFFLEDNTIILTAAILVLSALLLFNKQNRPSGRHKLLIIFIVLIEFLKVFAFLLSFGTWINF